MPHDLFPKKDEDIAAVSRYLKKRMIDSSAPVTDQAQFGEYMTQPSLIPGSKYHLYNSKETSLSNMDDDKERINYAWSKLRNRAIYMAEKGLVDADLPNEIDSLRLEWLNSTRGKNMEHEKLMVQQTINIRKTEETKSDKPGLFGKFGQKK